MLNVIADDMALSLAVECEFLQFLLDELNRLDAERVMSSARCQAADLLLPRTVIAYYARVATRPNIRRGGAHRRWHFAPPSAPQIFVPRSTSKRSAALIGRPRRYRCWLRSPGQTGRVSNVRILTFARRYFAGSRTALNSASAP